MYLPKSVNFLLRVATVLAFCSQLIQSAIALDIPEFDLYNGRSISYQELTSMNLAVQEFVNNYAKKTPLYYKKNGKWSLKISISENNKEIVCVLVGSANPNIRGGAAEYCIDTRTNRVIRFVDQR